MPYLFKIIDSIKRWSDYTLTVIDSVAKNGTFSAAAQELHRVPSAISYAVRQVEDWLAVEIFERRHRDVSLTAAGEHCIQEVRSVLKNGGDATKVPTIGEWLAWAVIHCH